MLTVVPLASGSAGNSYLVESDGTRVLVDAGLGPREADKRLKSVGRSITDIQAIVITHEHYDHVRGADKIAKKVGVPVHLTEGTLNGTNINREEITTVTFRNNTSFIIGELQFHARRTVHDATDPACFVVESRDGSRVGIASDLGCVDQPTLEHLTDCDALLFESNHDLDMLRMGTYPWSLKRRIMSRYGHLSNDDSMAALARMLGASTRSLCLIHLSEKNNHETIVRGMAEELLEKLGAKLDLRIARQSEPIEAIRVSRSRVPEPVAPPPRPQQLALFGI